MAYTRCLSNPDRLYIWEDEGKICICQYGVDFKTVPFQAWYKVFRQFNRSGFNKSLYLGNVVEQDGFRIQEIASEEGEKIFMSYNNKWEIEIQLSTFDSIKPEVIRQDIIPKPLISAEYFCRLKNWFKRIWRKYV